MYYIYYCQLTFCWKCLCIFHRTHTTSFKGSYDVAANVVDVLNGFWRFKDVETLWAYRKNNFQFFSNHKNVTFPDYQIIRFMCWLISKSLKTTTINRDTAITIAFSNWVASTQPALDVVLTLKQRLYNVRRFYRC